MMGNPRLRERGKIFIVSAPSGSGKTTLCRKLLAGNPGLKHSVSMTTRPARGDERDGVDYFFVSRARFEEKIGDNAFLEYEENFGNLYGTPKKFIEDRIKKGLSVLLSIDVKGAMKVRRAFSKESVLIFILPPSIAILKKRLESRMSDGPEDMTRRLGLAKKEIAHKNSYDYRIVNDRLDRAYRKLKDIIISELDKCKGE